MIIYIYLYNIFLFVALLLAKKKGETEYDSSITLKGGSVKDGSFPPSLFRFL